MHVSKCLLHNCCNLTFKWWVTVSNCTKTSECVASENRPWQICELKLIWINDFVPVLNTTIFVADRCLSILGWYMSFGQDQNLPWILRDWLVLFHLVRVFTAFDSSYSIRWRGLYRSYLVRPCVFHFSFLNNILSNGQLGSWRVLVLLQWCTISLHFSLYCLRRSGSADMEIFLGQADETYGGFPPRILIGLAKKDLHVSRARAT